MALQTVTWSTSSPNSLLTVRHPFVELLTSAKIRRFVLSLSFFGRPDLFRLP